MVAFQRNEDELAGLIGQELGHMASRAAGHRLIVNVPRRFGYQKPRNDVDLFERYNELVDKARLKSLHGGSDPEKGQELADQLGVQAVARAGYLPQAFPDLLDRLLETKGSTGSWLSDLFSVTLPNSKTASSGSARCIEPSKVVYRAKSTGTGSGQISRMANGRAALQRNWTRREFAKIGNSKGIE